MPSLDLTRLKTYQLAKRNSKVHTGELAHICRKGASFNEFWQSMPEILAARDLKRLASAIVTAHRKHRQVLLMMGAHVIKVGLGPIIRELIERRVVTAIALNGAGIIHDFELAYAGQTSEDVAEALEDGSFGMAEETHSRLNAAIQDGARRGWGLGYAVGRMIVTKKLPNRRLSILAACYARAVPATVHVAIGTDIIHQQASCDGAALGQTSLADFRTLVGVVSKLRGGVVGNVGSNVILPEVFLKALSVARNLGHTVKDFTAFDFDMIRHYRPRMNVLTRPISLGGQSFAVTGHHEILVPLLAQAIIEGL